MKNSLSKMNASWETTAMLMGDNWLKTIVRVVTPNALVYPAGSVQLLFRKRNGNSQCGNLYRGSADHGNYDKDSGAAVL